jgi:hypothetical protein
MEELLFQAAASKVLKFLVDNGANINAVAEICAGVPATQGAAMCI